MFRRRRSPVGPILLLLLALAAAVGGIAIWVGVVDLPNLPVAISPNQPTAVMSTPAAMATPAPTSTPRPLSWEEKARDTTTRFLEAWGRRDYAAMYGQLSTVAKSSITQDRFVTRYRAIMGGVGAAKISGSAGTVQLVPDDMQPAEANVAFTSTVESSRAEPIVEQNTMGLVREGEEWKINWTPDLIFQGLAGDNLVIVDPIDPPRARILDRKGRVLAGPGTVLNLGVVPGQLEDEARALAVLSSLLNVPEQEIKDKYAGAQPDWWVPLGDFPSSKQAEVQAKIANIEGVGLREKTLRVYPYGEVAAHVVGYVSHPTSEELAQLESEGYEEVDIIGRAGIEAWADKQLAGRKGGRILIMDSAGKVLRVIAERKEVPGADVHLTIDAELQKQAEAALADQVGSIVLMDPRDNSILALVSRPAYDPNLFIMGISGSEWNRLSSDPRQPFQNRPVASAYPTGSIFKVITMDAGLEKGGFSPETPFTCTGSWEGLPGLRMGDWKPEGHGNLDLKQGLVESCNIVFFEIGKKLDEIDPNLLPEYARQFGLGQATGLVGLQEVAGTVPDPAWKKANRNEEWFGGDTVNLGIGQGFLEATPLQMANMYSALANGGELRTPVLVRAVGDGEGATTYAFQPKNRLPGSEATLTTIREAMVKVASTEKGTAYYAFRGFGVPTAAKTGSAENQGPKAHAWFAGYAPADSPEIAVIVMVEGGEMGGEVAAPVARKVLDAYFAAPRN